MKNVFLLTFVIFSQYSWASHPPGHKIPSMPFQYDCKIQFSEQIDGDSRSAFKNISITQETLSEYGEFSMRTDAEGWTVEPERQMPTHITGHSIQFDFGYVGVPRAKDRVFVWVSVNVPGVGNANSQAFASYSKRETVEGQARIYLDATKTSLNLVMTCDRVK